MGICIYCGQPAGLLRRQHQECAVNHEQGYSEMGALASQAARGLVNLHSLEPKLAEVARRSYITADQMNQVLIRAWEDTVDHFLEDGDLNADEEKQLSAFKERFALSQEVLDRRGAYSKLVKAAILRDVMEGTIPQRLTVAGGLPFNFQKSEQLIWVFPNTAYYEDKTRRQYVGRSQGVSIRLAKGIYYRMGAFQGHPVETTERVYVDTGLLAVTNKHLYFAGPSKSLRIRHDKIVSFIPFEDGIGLQRDATTAKPQIFVTGDGWFTYNLFSNVSSL